MSGGSKRAIAATLLAPRIVLLLAALGLTLLGLVMVYSASSVDIVNFNLVNKDNPDIAFKSPAMELIKQVVFMVLGIGAGFAAYMMPPEFWRSKAVYGLVGLSVALIIATALVGTTVFGAKRWIVIGPVSLQCSEFCKIALVIMGAKLFADLRDGADGKEVLVKMVVFVVIPTLLLFKLQSDMGTTMIIVVGILAVAWLGDMPTRWFVLLAVAVFVFGVMAIAFGAGYRSERFLFLDPWNDGMNGYDKGYQIIHSYYAFSEGGILGTGLGNSHEKYQYLTQSDNDFIFAVLGEELGLLGGVCVLVAFLAILVAGLSISREADNQFARMVSGSLIAMLVFQALLNMGSAAGALPTTGKPLPFISSGGSSLISSMLIVGIVLSVTKASSSSPQARRDNLRVVRSERGFAGGLSPDSFRAVGTGRGSGRGSYSMGPAPSYNSPRRGSAPRGSFELGSVHRRDRY